MSTMPRIRIEDYAHFDQPFVQPWWQTLPEDYPRQTDPFRVPASIQRKISATATVDTAIRTAVACMAGAAAIPSVLRPALYAAEKTQRSFYQPYLQEKDPNAFFRPPTATPRVTYSPVSSYHFQPKDGEAHTLSFESPFMPINPAYNKRYLRNSRNQTAWAQYWRHNGAPRPTLIMIHGFVADPYWLNSRFLALPWFYKQGFDVLLYTLPFHGRRKSQYAPFSGAEFFSKGLTLLNETFAHAIHDLRIFMNHLRDQGTPSFGATGVSLGGYTTALLSSLEKDLAFAIPNVPVTSLVDIIASWFPINVQVHLLQRALQTDMAGLREITALHSPLTWPCLVPKERRLIIGGAGDRFAPPKHSHMLWQHWDQCGLHWFPGNHLVHLDQGRYLRAMRDFMLEAVADQGTM